MLKLTYVRTYKKNMGGLVMNLNKDENSNYNDQSTDNYNIQNGNLTDDYNNMNNSGSMNNTDNQNYNNDSNSGYNNYNNNNNYTKQNYNQNNNNQDYNNNFNNQGYNNDFNNGYNNFNNNYNNNFNNQGYNNFNNPNFNQNKRNSSGLAIASLILGILSIPAACCYGIGIVFAISGIILGVVSKKQTDGHLSGLAIAGIIISCLGVFTSIIMIICYVIIFTDPEFINELRSVTNSAASNSSFY